MGLRVLTVIEGSDAKAQTLGYSRALVGYEMVLRTTSSMHIPVRIWSLSQ